MPHRLLLAFCLSLPLVAGGAPIVLYDPQPGARPQDQPWLTYIAPLGPLAVAVPGGVTVNTTNPGSTADDANLLAGFFNHRLSVIFQPPFHAWSLKNPAFPTLDPADGFRLGFDLALRDEDHDSDHRAGFSVILLGQDRRGIELGFWEDLIFAQSGPEFLRAEQAAFDTTAGLIHYELTILLNEYILRAAGATVLSGPTRDYSPASPFPDPYDSPNMLFLGDDTSSAAADFSLGRISLATGPFDATVPAPPVWLLLAAALPWVGMRACRGH